MSERPSGRTANAHAAPRATDTGGSPSPRRSSARAVIIGAGIVGNSLVHHLARLGWRDLVLVDKGPMPNPGGSTGHAFTQDDFDPQLAEALQLMPELLGDENVGIRYAINGLISITPDGRPVLGEAPQVRGFWSAAASWIKEGPAEQWTGERRIRLAPMHAATCDLGAVFVQTAGWERPFWYESNAGLLAVYGDAVMRREAECQTRWWSPIINAEHFAMRENCALVDLSAFCIFDVTGPTSLEALQRLALAQLDVDAGKVVYTSFLDGRGGFLADLTTMRLAGDHFRIVTGGAFGMADRHWITAHLPANGSAQLTDLTSAWTTIGLWGPNARHALAAVTVDDVTDGGFPFATCRPIELAGVVALASRISYVGELGWEIHVPFDQGARVWSALYESGRPFGLVPAGIGVYGTTGRLEKGFRALGAELTPEYNLVEAGMARPSVKDQEFVGKAAYLVQRDQPTTATLCTLTVNDHTAADGRKRYMLGGEPVLSPTGERIVDVKGRPSYVTTAGSAPSLGKHLLLAYLPPEYARAGTSLLVEYMSERFPVTVAAAGATPLFDPENVRVRS